MHAAGHKDQRYEVPYKQTQRQKIVGLMTETNSFFTCIVFLQRKSMFVLFCFT